jgi:hypothetical protein
MANLQNDPALGLTPAGAKTNLTAFFDTRHDADNAIGRLEDAGIEKTAIRLMPGYEADTDEAAVAKNTGGGFWDRLEGWFFPDEDRRVYAEGLRRGGLLVSVQVDDANHDTALGILDDHGSIDIDERADLWRSEGWSPTRSNEALAQEQYDANRLGRDGPQEAASDVDLSAADARSAKHTVGPGRVHSYEFSEVLPDDQTFRDDVLPTGHQRTVDSSITSDTGAANRETVDPADSAQIQRNGFPR